MGTRHPEPLAFKSFFRDYNPYIYRYVKFFLHMVSFWRKYLRVLLKGNGIQIKKYWYQSYVGEDTGTFTATKKQVLQNWLFQAKSKNRLDFRFEYLCKTEEAIFDKTSACQTGGQLVLFSKEFGSTLSL